MPDYICRSATCAKSPQHAYGRFTCEKPTENCLRCGAEDIIPARKLVFNYGNSFMCLNCGRRSDFEEKQHEPYCMYCECEDVSWIPQKFASATHVDKTLRRIADRYKLSDMGQRGGTRMGESSRQARQQETPEKFVNCQGFQVPVTNGICSTWSTSNIDTKIKPAGVGQPYAGLRTPRAIPTKVAYEHNG
jgi:hypothetical protein